MVEVSPAVAIASIYCKCVSASFSIIGSSLIIYTISRDYKNNIKKTPNRFLMVMSFLDIIQSTFLALGVLCQRSSWSCSLQGFVVIFCGGSVPLYYAVLSIYYLMTIRFQYDVGQFQKRIEPFCHTCVIGAPLLTAICSVSLGLIEPTGQLCLISDPVLFILSTGILFVIHVSINVICIFLIYMHLYMTEREVGRNLYQSAVHLNLIAHRKKLARQARRFVFACLVTYVPPLFLEIDIQPSKNVVEILCSILFPLQGFWNFIIYILPLVESRRSEDANISFTQAIKKIVFGSTTGSPTNIVRMPQERRRRGASPEGLRRNLGLAVEEMVYIETSCGAEVNYSSHGSFSSNTSMLARFGFQSPPPTNVNHDPIGIPGEQSVPGSIVSTKSPEDKLYSSRSHSSMANGEN